MYEYAYYSRQQAASRATAAKAFIRLIFLAGIVLAVVLVSYLKPFSFLGDEGTHTPALRVPGLPPRPQHNHNGHAGHAHSHDQGGKPSIAEVAVEEEAEHPGHGREASTISPELQTLMAGLTETEREAVLAAIEKKKASASGGGRDALADSGIDLNSLTGEGGEGAGAGEAVETVIVRKKKKGKKGKGKKKPVVAQPEEEEPEEVEQEEAGAVEQPPPPPPPAVEKEPLPPPPPAVPPPAVPPANPPANPARNPDPVAAWSELAIPTRPGGWVPAQRPIPGEADVTSHSYEELTVHSMNPPRALSTYTAAEAEELRHRLVVAVALGVHSGRMQVGSADQLADLPLVKTLLNTFLPTAQPWHRYRFYFAFDHNDPVYEKAEYRTAIEALFARAFDEENKKRWHPSGHDVTRIDGSTLVHSVHWVHCDYSGKPSWAHSDAVMAAYKEGADYVYRSNDDSKFPEIQDWIDRFIEDLRLRQPVSNLGVVGPTCHEGATWCVTRYGPSLPTAAHLAPLLSPLPLARAGS